MKFIETFRLLKPDPTSRPTMASILDDEFFTTGFMPAGLPTSCLTMAPRFDTLKQADSSRKPLLELNCKLAMKYLFENILHLLYSASISSLAGLLPNKTKYDSTSWCPYMVPY